VNTTALAANPLWYATRAGGTIALILLTATVVLGIVVGGKGAPRRIGRFEIGLLHRNLAVLTLVFLALHIATAVLDPFVRLDWAVAVVPFGASYRPLWLGLGTVAFDLLLAVLITSALRFRLGRNRWKAVHWLAYAGWPLAVLHSITAGSDATAPWMLLVDAVAIGSVVAALAFRLTMPASPRAILADVSAGPAQAGRGTRR